MRISQTSSSANEPGRTRLLAAVLALLLIAAALF